ncbi:MAG TPA: hypothetical protein VGO91_12340 [Pyrinomonadaceae bacterium]|jgi:hypothetical protein|nr:hypothetical protein [Pyrinomonadaceae bacterium]
MMTEWLEQETSTHQDHVIAHVLGATVLGYFVFEEAAHLLLDIGFIWTILLDGEMGLVPQSLAIAELLIDDEAKAGLLDDAQRLHSDGPVDAPLLSSMKNAPADCLITEVDFYAHDEQRRIAVKCEGASLFIETSLMTREINIDAPAGAAG